MKASLRNLIACSIVLVALTSSYAIDDSFPGKIQLLPGYVHHRVEGEDSQVGNIAKAGGLIIHYDIGSLAGNRMHNLPQQDRRWTKTIPVNGREVEVAQSTKTGSTYITFKATEKYPWANFYAYTQSSEDLADMLLIAMSYVPSTQVR